MYAGRECIYKHEDAIFIKKKKKGWDLSLCIYWNVALEKLKRRQISHKKQRMGSLKFE